MHIKTTRQRGPTSMFTQALSAHKARLNNKMGLVIESRLMPLARTAVSSWSALNRPKIKSVAVNIPIGSANTQTKGINSRTASANTVKRTCPPIKNGRISLSTFPMRSTAVKTPTVISNDARIWRVKYACSVFTTGVSRFLSEQVLGLRSPRSPSPQPSPQGEGVPTGSCNEGSNSSEESCVLLQPSLGPGKIRTEPRHLAPETARMIHLFQVRQFVENDVVAHEQRRLDQPPIQ